MVNKIFWIFFFVGATCASADGDPKMQIAFRDGAKIICDEVHLKFISEKPDSVEKLKKFDPEISETCINMRVKGQIACNDAFLAKVQELGKGQVITSELKAKIRKEFVPEQDKCLKESDQIVVGKINKVMVFLFKKKIKEAKALLEEYKQPTEI